MDRRTSHDRFPSPALESAQLARLAKALLGEADGEDGVQEAWVRALERREGRRIDGAWMRGTVRNVARESWRAGRRRKRREAAAAIEPTRGEDPRTLERLAAHELISTSLAQLEEPFRTTLVWRYLDGRSAAEIARLLAAPATTVRWRLREGRRRLRVILEDRAQADGRSAPAVLFSLAAGTGASPIAPWGAWLMAKSGTQVARWTAVLVVALAVVGVGLLVGTSDWGADALDAPREAAVLADAEEASPALRGTPHASEAAAEVVAEPEDEAILDPFRVRGRVLDGARRPVSGALVTLHTATRTWEPVRTDATGSYGIVCSSRALGAYAAATVVARTDDGRMGTASMRFDTHEVDRAPVEPIVLEAAARLRVRVSAGGGAVEGAAVVVEQRRHFVAYEMRATVASGTTDASGLWQPDEPLAGAFTVHVAHPEYGRGRRYLRLGPSGDQEVAIALAPARTVDVRVVHAEDDAPVVGGLVSFVANAGMAPRPLHPPVEPVTTDEEGRARIVGVPGGRVYARVEAAGLIGPIPDYKKGWAVALSAGETTLTLRMRRDEPLRLPITEGEAGVPPDGTELVVYSMHGEPGIRAHIEDDHVVVHNAPFSMVGSGDQSLVGSLVAPDGRVAGIAWMMGRLLEPLVFEAPRELVVRVRHADGQPAVGLNLGVAPRHSGLPPVVTDQEGLATARGLKGDTITLSRKAPEPFVMGMSDAQLLGRCDLRTDPQPFEITLPAQKLVRLAIRIDGESRLPTRYRVLHHGALVHWQDIEEDPARGELLLRRPLTDDDQPFRVLAEGLLGDTVTVNGAAPEDTVYTVALRSSATFELEITPPEGGQYRLALQRWDAAGERWVRAPREPDMQSNAVDGRDWIADHRVRYTRIPSGRYRVLDWVSLTASAPVDVEAGGEPGHTVLDLGKIVRVRGRVVVPSGETMHPVSIHVQVDGVDRRPNWNIDGPLVPSGRFSFAAPVGSEVVVRLEHKRLHPREPEGVSFTVRRGRKDVLLHLDAGGARVRFEATSAKEGIELPPRLPCIVRTADEGAEPERRVAERQDGVYVLDLRPSTEPVSIVVDPGEPFAPQVLKPRAYAAGAHTLPALTFGTGGQVRVRTLVPGGGSRPMIRVVVRQTIAGHAFTRQVWSERGKTSDLVVAGLVAGEAQVRVGPGRMPAGSMTVGGPMRAPPPEIVERVTLSRDGEVELKVTITDDR